MSLLKSAVIDMCGITGLLAPNILSEQAHDHVARSLRAISRRGPDGQAVFQAGPCTLGHARLAVIDTTPTGAQPLTISDTTIVFNGEIYNFFSERQILEKKCDLYWKLGY